MKVENLIGYANQFVLTDRDTDTYETRVFQSYNSKIAEMKFTLNWIKLKLEGEMWNYSVTTRRHFKAFINEYTPFTYENKAQWLKEIESNESIEVL